MFKQFLPFYFVKFMKIRFMGNTDSINIYKVIGEDFDIYRPYIKNINLHNITAMEFLYVCIR